jgi:hypothetical protein
MNTKTPISRVRESEITCLRKSTIEHYWGALSLVEVRGKRYFMMHCSFLGRRFFGPLNRHHVMAFNTIAAVPECKIDEINGGATLGSCRTLATPDIDASSISDESEFFVFRSDQEYDQGSLAAHLKYLSTYSGTPDFCDRAETLAEAVDQARENAPAVITNSLFEVLTSIDEPVEA